MTLESVVSLGTGRNAYIDGYRVGGKTGTAQKVNNGVYMHGNYIVSFIGFLPANDPKIVVYLAIDNPKGVTQYGGTVSAPIVKNILEDAIVALDIPKQEGGTEKKYQWYDQKYYEVENVIGLTKKEASSKLKKFTTIVKNLYFNGKVLEDKPVIKEYDLGLPVQFSKTATAQRGLSTGYNKLFINPPFGIPTIPILASPKNIVGYTANGAKTEQLLYAYEPLSETTKTYLEKCKKEIQQSKKPAALYQKIWNNETWYNLPLKNSRGIIFSYFIRNDVRFIKNDTNFVVRDNFYIITPKIDTNLLFALLNNYFTFYQLELLGKKYGAGLLKIQRYDLEKIMFPNYLLFSQYDLILLNNLSNQLIQTGNKELILEITRVISKYTLVDVDFITTQYSLLKKQRLEAKI